MTDDTSDRYLINSVTRACNVMRMLAKEGDGLRVGKIAKRLGIDRTTAYRILVTLESNGFLERNSDSKEYKLGVGAFEIGSAYLRATDLHSIARPVMIELAGRVQEGVHWAILSGDQAVCIDKIDSPRGLGTTSKIGRSSALNAGSVGKTLLAFQPPEVREKLLETVHLDRFTDHTITSVEEMQKAIGTIRAEGYCISVGEGEEDMACVAAPIFNHSRQIIAGLSIGGPVHRFSAPEFQRKAISGVLWAAQLISEKMGCPAIPSGKEVA